jgi:hypothetical protein
VKLSSKKALRINTATAFFERKPHWLYDPKMTTARLISATRHFLDVAHALMENPPCIQGMLDTDAAIFQILCEPSLNHHISSHNKL